MKINEIIAEAKFAKPSIYYHGTSTRHLKTILSQGLDASRAGTGWGSTYNHTSELARDLVAVGGVYLTKDPDLALEAARESQVKLDRDKPVFVVVQYQPRHGVLDEDEVDVFVGRRVSKILGLRQRNVFLALYDVYTDKRIAQDSVYSHSDDFSAQIEKHPEGMTLARQLIIHELRRRAAHRLVRAGRDSMEISEAARIRKVDPEKILDLLPEDPQQGEEEYKKALKRGTVVLKNIAHKDSKDVVNIRSRQSIGFSGANKIIAIIAVDEKNDKFIVEYGEPTKEVISQLRKLPGFFSMKVSYR